MEKKNVNDFLYEQDSYKIRGACFNVWNAFKGIFKEKILENALKRELEDQGLKIESQKRINIYYKDEKVGVYTPDLIINGRILVEIKAKPYLTKEDEKQFWYYLQGSQYKLGFLINFGTKKLEIRRRIYDKARQRYKLSAFDQRPYQRLESASIKKGFTIIELIVVVAVIGILAAIIFVAGGSARNKAKDAKIQSSLLQIQNQAEQLYLGEGSYTKVSCASAKSPEIAALCQDLSQLGSSVSIYPASPTNVYCAYAQLSTQKMGFPEFFCVDAINFAGKLILPGCSSLPYLCL